MIPYRYPLRLVWKVVNVHRFVLSYEKRCKLRKKSTEHMHAKWLLADRKIGNVPFVYECVPKQSICAHSPVLGSYNIHKGGWKRRFQRALKGDWKIETSRAETEKRRCKNDFRIKSWRYQFHMRVSTSQKRNQKSDRYHDARVCG